MTTLTDPATIPAEVSFRWARTHTGLEIGVADGQDVRARITVPAYGTAEVYHWEVTAPGWGRGASGRTTSLTGAHDAARDAACRMLAAAS